MIFVIEYYYLWIKLVVYSVIRSRVARKKTNPLRSRLLRRREVRWQCVELCCIARDERHRATKLVVCASLAEDVLFHNLGNGPSCTQANRHDGHVLLRSTKGGSRLTDTMRLDIARLETVPLQAHYHLVELQECRESVAELFLCRILTGDGRRL